MADIGGSEVRCPMCGTPSDESARFCPQCGYAVEAVTRTLDAPSRGHEPVAQTIVEPPGVQPHRRVTASLTFAAFIVALLLTVLFSAFGQWLIGLLLAPITLALGVVWGNTAWEWLERDSGHAVRSRVVNLRAAVRVVRAFLVNWSRAGRTELRLRARQHQLRRQQDDLLRSLGEAVYLENERRAEVLKRTAVANADQIEQCGRELQSARRRASERVETERSAAAPTQVLEARGPSGRLSGQRGPGVSGQRGPGNRAS